MLTNLSSSIHLKFFLVETERQNWKKIYNYNKIRSSERHGISGNTLYPLILGYFITNSWIIFITLLEIDAHYGMKPKITR